MLRRGSATTEWYAHAMRHLALARAAALAGEGTDAAVIAALRACREANQQYERELAAGRRVAA